MTDTSSEILNIPFAEYGKVYIPRNNPRDFEQLAMSDPQTASSLYDLYNKIAVDETGSAVPFTSRKPGFGNFSAALMKDPRGSGNYLYIQFHQRLEGESLWIFEGWPVGQEILPSMGDRNNRAFRQAKFSVLPPSLILRKFQEGFGLYTTLLEVEEGRPYLKTYFLREGQRFTRKSSSPEESSYHPITDDELDLNIVDGLTDLLIKNQSNLAANTAVILVTSISDVETRLRLVQAAQARLLPALGVFTFTLDFIHDHYFQFYFCTELPPAWMFTNPVIFWDSSLASNVPNGCRLIDLTSFAQSSNGYSRSIRNIFKGNKFSDPVAGQILGNQSIPQQDRVRIAEILISKNEPLPDNLPDLLLDNFRTLGSSLGQEIVVRAFEKTGMIESILQKAPQKIQQAPFRNQLYKMIFMHASENRKLELVDYYHFYRQLNKNDQTEQSLREMFLKVVRSSIPENLKKGADDNNIFLFIELMSLGIKSELKFRDGTSIVKTILKLPGAPLFGAIKLLIEQNVWDDVFQNELEDAIFRVPEIWNSDNQNALVAATGIKLPDMFIRQVALILEDNEQLEKLEKDPQLLFFKLGQILLIKAENTQEPLLALFTNDDIKQKLRQICVKICIPSGMDNLRFAKMWLRELSKADGSVFRDDYLEIISQNKNVSPLSVSKKDKENYGIYHLLIGRPDGELSLYVMELCRATKLEDRYNTIMEIWIKKRFFIQVEDINELVYQLPDSNDLLGNLLIYHPSGTGQHSEICNLQENEALKWLKATSKNDLRKIYFNAAKEDLLYSVLSGINKPSAKFAIYLLLDEDPFAYRSDISWKEYKDRINMVCEKLARHIDKNPQASKFVEMVNCFSCPTGKEALHRFGLLCLATRTVGSDGVKPFKLSIDDNKELRLILTYALGKGINKIIAEPARKILEEYGDYFLARFPDLKDDEVYTLHFFYADRKGITKNVIIEFTNEGWRRVKQPPSKNGKWTSFSQQNPGDTDPEPPLINSNEDTLKRNVYEWSGKDADQTTDDSIDNSQKSRWNNNSVSTQRINDQAIIRRKSYVVPGKSEVRAPYDSKTLLQEFIKVFKIFIKLLFVAVIVIVIVFLLTHYVFRRY